MTPEEQQQVNAITVDVRDMIEGFRAQRTEAQDKQVEWFAKFMAATRRADAAEARVKELEEKCEPKPKPEAVT